MIAPIFLLVLFGFVAFLVLIVLLILVATAKPKREYGVRSVTAKGEGVRSIAERRIADYFAKNNINYAYEDRLVDYRIGPPDFYLPDYDVYVEYWGLVDADDGWTKERYVRNMKRKMAIYYQHNIKFISLYPYDMVNLDWVFRRKFKKVTGFELPS